MLCFKFMSLMPSVAGSDLPPEVARQIFVACLERSENWVPIKRGLATRGLMYRYWVGLTRRMLIEGLTLRGPEDVSLLLAFANSPQFLKDSIEESLRHPRALSLHNIQLPSVLPGARALCRDSLTPATLTCRK